MLAYAVKLTQTPGEMAAADVEALRAAGFSDRDILDIAEVTAYYAYANRIADGLGVNPEGWLPEDWAEASSGPAYGAVGSDGHPLAVDQALIGLVAHDDHRNDYPVDLLGHNGSQSHKFVGFGHQDRYRSRSGPDRFAQDAAG